MMKTELTLGIIGFPIGHSLSPLIYETAAREAGLKISYSRFETAPADLARAVDGIRALSIRGVNVTIPHKVKIIDKLDELDERARAIGAVNLIVNDSGKLKGYNSDMLGFMRALKIEGKIDPRAKKTLLIGAGGAARAIGFGLARAGGELSIVNRSAQKGAELARDIEKEIGSGSVESAPIDRADLIEPLIASADLIVNATSVGMGASLGDRAPISLGSASSGALVVDIVYSPLETPLLRAARDRGLRALDGLAMLINQAEDAFELFTGLRGSFPSKKIRRALESKLNLNE